MPNYSVQGRVYRASRTPYTGPSQGLSGYVQAYHVGVEEFTTVGPGGTKPDMALGAVTVLDNQGGYSIDYDPADLLEAGLRYPNLLIVVFDSVEATTEVTRSEVCFQAGDEATINIIIPSASPGDYAIESVGSALTGSSTAIRDLSNDAVGFVAATSGLPRAQVRYLRDADALVGGDATQRDRLMALTADQSYESPLQKLIASDADLDQAATDSTTRGWPLDGNDLKSDRSTQIQAYLGGTGTEAGGLRTVRELMGAQGISLTNATEGTAFVEAYLNHNAHSTPGVAYPAAFWSAWPAERLGFELRDITGGNFELVRQLLSLVFNSDYALDRVAELSASALATAVQTAGTTGIPAEITGADSAERIAKYTTVIDRILAALCPSARFKRDIQANHANALRIPVIVITRIGHGDHRDRCS